MLNFFHVLKFQVKIFSLSGAPMKIFLHMKMATYELQWCVRGYHIYIEESVGSCHWGRAQMCKRDRVAVAVVRKNVVIHTCYSSHALPQSIVLQSCISIVIMIHSVLMKTTCKKTSHQGTTDHCSPCLLRFGWEVVMSWKNTLG